MRECATESLATLACREYLKRQFRIMMECLVQSTIMADGGTVDVELELCLFTSPEERLASSRCLPPYCPEMTGK